MRLLYVKEALDTRIERNVIANNGVGVLLQAAAPLVATQSNMFQGNRADVQRAPAARPTTVAPPAPDA